MNSYLEKFSRPTISFEDMLDIKKGKIFYIETDRFTAHSLHSSIDTFDDYSDEIKKLYEITFSNSRVMEKYKAGRTRTQEQFQDLVNDQSRRWEHAYPFGGFIVTNNDTDEIVGYEIIGNGRNENTPINNTGEMCYLFNPSYHRSDVIKDVGYENIGALSLEYGQFLFQRQELVNQDYNYKNDKYEDGSVFTKLLATVRDDNVSSKRILEKIGCDYISDQYKHGYNRHVFEKTYRASLNT
eukprot:TRINITY_DN6640_c0_g1_i1.p1 TRINITY_DN6640_c0_g1~~TRINITY_DN6640_c0_g1_i1.p1  ORF type:complete len:240 (-),score=4.04 TRINITY_DN6640_c0_g1_i1:72-791(-)